MSLRIIPRLEIKGPNLVKGVHLEGLRVLGSPQEFARHYYQQGADELLYHDVVASLYQRNSLLEIIERTSRELFIPLMVGGGLRSPEDIRRVLLAGADKVSLNTAVIGRPALITEVANRFGSSTIVVAIEAKKRSDGSYEAYVDCGRERTGVEVFEWAKRVVELGAGEILLTAIDREGTGRGFDLELTRRVSQSVSVPVIAHGGAGTIRHVQEAIEEGAADAICLSSLPHYDFVETSASATSSNGRLPKRSFSQIKPCSLPNLKRVLAKSGIECRVEGHLNDA
jgi:imidazole glycerol-phosphate synthase subunit HisF